MMLDWQHFTPASSLAGGGLIGLASVVLLLGLGRIAGISGILASLLRSPSGGGWRYAFIGGLLLASLLISQLYPMALPQAPSLPEHWQGWVQLGVGGVLVGLGTRLANGCTSGHGVCGLARLSVRSLTAVLTFMGSGFATVFVTRHLLGA